MAVLKVATPEDSLRVRNPESDLEVTTETRETAAQKMVKRMEIVTRLAPEVGTHCRDCWIRGRDAALKILAEE